MFDLITRIPYLVFWFFLIICFLLFLCDIQYAYGRLTPWFFIRVRNTGEIHLLFAWISLFFTSYCWFVIGGLFMSLIGSVLFIASSLRIVMYYCRYQINQHKDCRRH